MTILPPSPFITDSAADRTSLAVDTAVAPNRPPATGAAATQSSTATGGQQEAPAVEQLELPQAAGATDYIPEPFSEYAHRRCMPIISPPLPQQCRREFEPDMDALFDAIVPPEPPPVFLRSPSQAFMRALFELSH